MPKLIDAQRCDHLTSARATRDLASGQALMRQVLVARARYLGEREMAVVRLAWVHGLPVREIARAVGRAPGTIVRRLRVLEMRLRDPVVVALADPACPLPERDRNLGLGFYLRREALRKLAPAAGLTRAQARTRLRYLQGWALGRKEGARIALAIRSDNRPGADKVG